MYIGAAGVAAYNEAFGIDVDVVPIEDGARPGTSGSHPEEGTGGVGDSVRVYQGIILPPLTTEISTGFFNNGVVNPISKISIGMLEDLGWTVDYTHAQSFPA